MTWVFLSFRDLGIPPGDPNGMLGFGRSQGQNKMCKTLVKGEHLGAAVKVKSITVRRMDKNGLGEPDD